MTTTNIKFNSDWYLLQIILRNSWDDLKKKFNAVAETLTKEEEIHAQHACVDRAFERYEENQDAFGAIEALLKQ